MAQRCTRTLVVNVQGGNDTLGDDPGVETARPARVHASAEDQLHLAWSTDVEVFTNDLLEERSACRWPVEHLGQGKLRLQNRDLVPVTGVAIGGGVGMGEPAQPFSQQGVDLLCRQGIAERLGALGVIAGQDAIVQGLKANPSMLQLPFEPFVAIETQFGIIGKVAAEFEEEGPEVAIHTVDVEVVDHRRGARQPRPVLLLHRRSVRKTRLFSWALPMNRTPSSPLNFFRYSTATSSLRSPLRNCTTGTRCCLAKRSNRATNSLLIGSISALEAKRCPRWNRKKAATPPSR